MNENKVERIFFLGENNGWHCIFIWNVSMRDQLSKLYTKEREKKREENLMCNNIPFLNLSGLSLGPCILAINYFEIEFRIWN